MIFFVSAALLGTTLAQTCTSDPTLCLTCFDCNNIVRQGGQNNAFFWVATTSDSSDPGPGACQQRYDPVGSSSIRQAASASMCGKRIFIACSGGITSSVIQSSPVVRSSASELKISSSITVSLVAGLALYLIIN